MSAQLVYISKELACIAFRSEPLWLVMSAGELCSELKDLAAFVVARGGMPSDEAAKAAVSKNIGQLRSANQLCQGLQLNRWLAALQDIGRL